MFWISQSTPMIISGSTALIELEKHINSGRILLCSSKTVIEKAEIKAFIRNLRNERVEIFSNILPNPSFQDVENKVVNVISFQPDVIVAIGGGSVIDFAKILALVISAGSGHSIYDLQQIASPIKRNNQLIAIPTTCGTGAEVTQFATIWDKKGKSKDSIENLALRPDICVLNGELSASSKGEQVLYSGLDAMSHCIETLWNKNSNSWSVGFATHALASMLRVFPRLIAGAGTKLDWQTMQESSMYAGLAISQSYTALAHSISYPITAHYQVPHGLACSFSIPYIWKCLGTSTKHELAHLKLMERAIDFIDSLNLKDEIIKFASIEQIRGLDFEMISTKRASNFINEVDKNLISQVLDQI